MNSRILLLPLFLALAAAACADVLLGNYPQTNDSTQLAGATPVRFKAFRFINPLIERTLLNVRARVSLTSTAFGAGNFPVVRIHADGTTPGTVLATLALDSPAYAVGIFDYIFEPASSFQFAANTTYWLTLAGTNTTGGLDFKASLPAVPYSGLTTVLANSFTTNGTTFTASVINQTWEIIVAGAPSQSISGNVVLENFTATPLNRLVDFEVLDSTNNIVYSANNVPLGPGGIFSLSTVLEPGTYSVRGKGTHWLRRVVTDVVVSSSGATGVTISMKNGDVTDDNEVGPADFSSLALAFGSFLGDSNYTDAADLNGDAEVGPADFAILAGNFGEFGD